MSAGGDPHVDRRDETDCVECEEPDFVCEVCGCGFCLDHASTHTIEECERFRNAPPEPAR